MKESRTGEISGEAWFFHQTLSRAKIHAAKLTRATAWLTTGGRIIHIMDGCGRTDASPTTLTISDTPAGWSKAPSNLTMSLTINAYVCWCYCFHSATRKGHLMKWQWCKEKPFLFNIYNTSLSSEGKSNQSTYSTFTRSASLQNELIKAAIQPLSCYALVALLSQFNMHVSTHGATKQTNAKAICNPERRIAITIFATSHWFTHLFFCRAMAMEKFNLYVGDDEAFVDGVKKIS